MRKGITPLNIYLRELSSLNLQKKRTFLQKMSIVRILAIPQKNIYILSEVLHNNNEN